MAAPGASSGDEGGGAGSSAATAMLPPQLPISFDGPEDGPVLFFVHGWPDDEDVWDPQVKHFVARGYRCARITMPHFAKSDRLHSGMCFSSGGYTFEQMADMIHDAVQRIRSRQGDAPVLVLHDWGCGWGSYAMKKYPAIAKAVVMLDVAAVVWLNIGREPTLLQYCTLLKFGIMYQYANIALFFLSRVWGLGWLLRKCWPIEPWAMYSYWHLHRDHLAHALLRLLGRRWLPSWQISPVEQFPPCPTLFLWGAAKPKSAMFHEQSFVDGLRARSDGSAAFGVDAGHYLMSDKNHFGAMSKLMPGMAKLGRPDEVHALMDAFFDDLHRRGTVRPRKCFDDSKA